MDFQIKIDKIDDVDWIIEATYDVAHATEENLDEIKTKKWYVRLLDTVTFSKDNQIHTAKDICSLAKLQEIITRVSIIVIRENEKLSTQVDFLENNLEHLVRYNAELKKEIQKIKFGGTSQIDFNDISREKKYIITSLLILNDDNSTRTELSRQFIGSLLSACYISVDDTIKIDAVESLNRYEQELLYRLIIVDRLLNGIDYNAESLVIDRIAISITKKNEIYRSVQATAKVVPTDFFATYYEKQANNIDQVNDSDILLNAINEEAAEEYKEQVETDNHSQEEEGDKTDNNTATKYLKQNSVRDQELDEMVEAAERVVNVAVGTAAATCAVPIPFADAPLLIAEQIVLLTTICGIFKINIKKDGIKALVSAAFGVGGATLIGRTLAVNLFKILPGLGSVAGGVISAGTAGVVTLAMGKSFIEVCKATKMGKLREDEITTHKGKKLFKQTFKDQIEKAKQK